MYKQLLPEIMKPKSLLCGPDICSGNNERNLKPLLYPIIIINPSERRNNRKLWSHPFVRCVTQYGQWVSDIFNDKRRGNDDDKLYK